jgi:hypothetical protein
MGAGWIPGLAWTEKNLSVAGNQTLAIHTLTENAVWFEYLAMGVTKPHKG